MRRDLWVLTSVTLNPEHLNSYLLIHQPADFLPDVLLLAAHLHYSDHHLHLHPGAGCRVHKLRSFLGDYWFTAVFSHPFKRITTGKAPHVLLAVGSLYINR